MDSQTRQMELVVQSLADSIEFSLEEYPRPPGLRGCQGGSKPGR